MSLGKRKAEYDISPDNPDGKKQSLFDLASETPLDSAEEIAKRPPLSSGTRSARKKPNQPQPATQSTQESIIPDQTTENTKPVDETTIVNNETTAEPSNAVIKDSTEASTSEVAEQTIEEAPVENVVSIEQTQIEKPEEPVVNTESTEESVTKTENTEESVTNIENTEEPVTKTEDTPVEKQDSYEKTSTNDADNEKKDTISEASNDSEKKVETTGETSESITKLPFTFIPTIFGTNTTSSSTPTTFLSSSNIDVKPFGGTSNLWSSGPFSADPFSSSGSSIEFKPPTDTPSAIGINPIPQTPVENDIPEVKQLETQTGEEDEDKLHSTFARVYNFSVPEGASEKTWVERGRGDLKLNVKKDDKSKSRVVFRVEKTHKLVLNMPLFNDTKIVRASDTAIQLSGCNIEAGEAKLESFLIKLRTKEDTDFLFELLNKHSKMSTVLTSDAPVSGHDQPSSDSQKDEPN